MLLISANHLSLRPRDPLSCVCPSFHVDSQVNYMKPTWKQGRAYENAEKGPRGHRDLKLVELSSIE